MIPEKHRKRLETVGERCRGYRKYIPIVGMCLLVLLSVVASTAVLTQPVAKNQSGSVEAQKDIEATVFAATDFSGAELAAYDSDGNKEFSNTDGTSSRYMAISPDNTKLYALPEASDTVAVIDTQTGNTINNVTVPGKILITVAVDPSDTYLYVASGNGEITKVEIATNNTVWTTSFSGSAAEPRGVSVNKDGSRIAVASRNNEEAAVLDSSGNIITSVSLDNNVNDAEIHPTKNIFYVLDSTGTELEAYDFTGSLLWSSNLVDADYVSIDASGERLVSNDNSEYFIFNPSTGGIQNRDTLNGVDTMNAIEILGDSVYLTAEDFGGDPLVQKYKIGGNRTWTTSNLTGVIPFGIEVVNPVPAPFDPELEIDTRNYLKHGNSSEYTVYYTDPDTGNTSDVTNDSGLQVNSSNTTVFTLNTTANRVVATSNRSINARENITAEYEGLTQKENVTVANATVDNLEILPGVTRVEATYTDSNIVLILIGTMLGVVATRASSAFAGIATIQLVLVAGFFVDLISLGVVLVGLFGALFIGLNLAANIDYTVRG